MSSTFIITGHAYDREQTTLFVDAPNARSAVASFRKTIREAEGASREVIIEMVLSVPADAGSRLCDADSEEALAGRYVAIGHLDDNAPTFRSISAGSPADAADRMLLALEGIAEGDEFTGDYWCDAVIYIGQSAPDYHSEW